MADSDIAWQADMFQNQGIKDADGKKSKYDPASPLTMPDVPGNYNNVALLSCLLLKSRLLTSVRSKVMGVCIVQCFLVNF